MRLFVLPRNVSCYTNYTANMKIRVDSKTATKSHRFAIQQLTFLEGALYLYAVNTHELNQPTVSPFCQTRWTGNNLYSRTNGNNQVIIPKRHYIWMCSGEKIYILLNCSFSFALFFNHTNPWTHELVYQIVVLVFLSISHDLFLFSHTKYKNSIANSSVTQQRKSTVSDITVKPSLPTLLGLAKIRIHKSILSTRILLQSMKVTEYTPHTTTASQGKLVNLTRLCNSSLGHATDNIYVQLRIAGFSTILNIRWQFLQRTIRQFRRQTSRTSTRWSGCRIGTLFPVDNLWCPTLKKETAFWLGLLCTPGELPLPWDAREKLRDFRGGLF